MKTIPAWAMLAIGIIATFLVTLQVEKEVAHDAAQQFAFHCDRLRGLLQERLSSYALILRGGAGLFVASESVERDEWRSFCEILRAHEHIPGVQGLGFSKLLLRNQLSDHIGDIREEGFEKYTVSPPGDRDRYAPVIYLEPFRDRNLRAFGYDMLSEPARRAAMERACDTDEVALTGKVELVQETGTEVQAGILMYFPVYRKGAAVGSIEQRRDALIGWVHSSYRMDDFMRGVLANSEEEGGNFHVYDGDKASPANLLFDSCPGTPLSQFCERRTIDFGGRRWLLVLSPTQSSVTRLVVWAVGIGGLALSGLVCGLMLSLIHTRSRADHIAHDLTRESRIHEARLTESEYRWRFALEGAGDGVWDWNIAESRVFFSKIWKTMLGYSEEEIGTNLDEWTWRVHPDDLPQTMAATRAHFEGTTPLYTSEYRVQCKDGSWKWILARGLVVSRDPAGKPLRVIGTHTDISKRKAAEEELRASEEKFRAISDYTVDWEIWFGPDGKILWLSPSVERITGYSVAEVLAMPDFISTLIEEEDRNIFTVAFQSALGGSNGDNVEFRCVHKEGAMFWLGMSWQPIFDARGASLGVRANGRDITARKQVEEELVAKTAEMERFTYTVSHDLKSPLVTIKTFLGYLENDIRAENPGQVAKDLTFISTAAEKMERLLDELLQLARIGHNKNPLVEVPLQEIVQEALGLVAGQIAERGVHVDVTPEPVCLFGDRSRLVEVFQNLVDNAVKFLGDQPSPRVEIGVVHNGAEIELFVRDNGKGIDPRHQHKIFGFFERLDTSAPGSGLGLAMVRRIIELHGGKIRAESDGPGLGATFRFTLEKSRLKPKERNL